jgi:transposase
MDVIPAGPMRRRWTAEAKARIIASSFEPGANIAEIARTHGLLPQQLYAWRHDSIPGKRLASKKLGFVPAVIEGADGTSSTDGGGDEIVIRTATLAIHVPSGAREDHIARVLAAVSRSG